MQISDAILPEFDHEASNTRRTLERVPADKFTWKPHPKSFSMGDLAIHLATLAGWTQSIVNSDKFDMGSPEAAQFKPPALKNARELVEAFDKNAAIAREAIARTSNEDFMKMWSLVEGDKVYLTMPKIACVRAFVMSHAIHHRAQLGVYLRMNDVPVPAIYGPSADETGM